MNNRKKEQERAIDRLIKFADWCVESKLCKSKTAFENYCGLSHNYLYNASFNSKSSVGSDRLLLIHQKFPMLNLTWVITGRGNMFHEAPDVGYKAAYNEMRDKVKDIKKKLKEIESMIKDI